MYNISEGRTVEEVDPVGESTRSRSSPTQREEERDSPSPTMNMDDVQLLLRSPEITASKEPAENQWLVARSNLTLSPKQPPHTQPIFTQLSQTLSCT